MDRILDASRLRKEIGHLTKTLEFRRRIGDEKAIKGQKLLSKVKVTNDDDDDEWLGSEKVRLLLEWVQLTSAHYGLQVDNWTVSFSDGRALCSLLHHYYPEFLLSGLIEDRTTVSAVGQSSTVDMDDSFGSMTYSRGNDPKMHQELINNEKKNFKLFHEKVSEVTSLQMVPVVLVLLGMEFSTSLHRDGQRSGWMVGGLVYEIFTMGGQSHFYSGGMVGG